MATILFFALWNKLNLKYKDVYWLEDNCISKTSFLDGKYKVMNKKTKPKSYNISPTVNGHICYTHPNVQKPCNLSHLVNEKF